MPDLVDDEQGRISRYHDWMCQVAVWTNQHDITMRQAMSILFETTSIKNKVTAKELLSWAECDDFYSIFKEKHDD